jgi:hypothetical protein
MTKKKSLTSGGENIKSVKKARRRKQPCPAPLYERQYTGTMAIDPGQTNCGWAVVGYIGGSQSDYTDARNYVVRNCDVIDFTKNGRYKTLSDIATGVYEVLSDKRMLRYTADTTLAKVLECQEGFSFGKTGRRYQLYHTMIRMGTISGISTGVLLSMGNSVRYMTKTEKWRIGMSSGRKLPSKQGRVEFVLEMLRKQRNQRMIDQIERLGKEKCPKAMEDASDAILMAMENTRKMVANTVGY